MRICLAHIPSRERVPRSFDIRIAGLKEIAASIYKNEPDEYRIFSWYVQRLRTLNGRRDDLAHGLPGKVTKKGRTYDGIKIPFPSRDTKYSELTVEDIEELAEDLKAMEGELIKFRWRFSKLYKPHLAIYQFGKTPMGGRL